MSQVDHFLIVRLVTYFSLILSFFFFSFFLSFFFFTADWISYFLRSLPGLSVTLALDCKNLDRVLLT